MLIDRSTVAELHEQLRELLDGFAAARNLQAKLGAATFTGNNVQFKIELAVLTPTGHAMTREAETFVLHAACHGLAAADLGKSITHNGTTYKIIGMNPRSRKTPILVADDAGRQYKMPASLLKALLAIPAGGVSERATCQCDNGVNPDRSETQPSPSL